jgi:hypothetical protein
MAQLYPALGSFYFVSYDSRRYGEGILARSTQVQLSHNHNSQVKITVRLTISQSVYLGFEPTLGLVTRYCFMSEG